MSSPALRLKHGRQPLVNTKRKSFLACVSRSGEGESARAGVLRLGKRADSLESGLVDHADAVEQVKSLHEVSSGEFALQELLVEGNEVGCLLRIFVQQLQTEAVEPAAAHALRISGSGLSTSVEESVAASFIAAQVVHGVGAVHDTDAVVFTGATAVLEAVPL